MATTISGTVTTGVTLSSAEQNPLSVTATGYVTNTGDAVYGTNAAAWTVSNLGTIRGGSGPSAGVNLQAGGTVANSAYIEGKFAGYKSTILRALL
jgi:hypothetical protein